MMNKDRLNETLSIALGIISVIAIVALVIKSGFDTSELLSSIINFTQVAIPVLVLLVATTIKRESKSYYHVGKEILESFSKKYSSFFAGPGFSRENYDPEKGKGLEYLFIKEQKPASKNKSAFITLQPFEVGRLDILIQKSTLVWGLKYKSEEATIEEIEKIVTHIFSELSSYIDKNYKQHLDWMDKTDVKNNKARIMIDFEEERMGKKRFQKAIINCIEIAIKVLKSYEK